MQDFDLIDDYLTNRLGEQEKAAFEQRLASDASLQSDLERQRSIVEGVRKARIAELKAMLNNVPVGGGLSASLTAGKIAAAIMAAGLIGTSVYLYLHKNEMRAIQSVATTVQPVVVPAPDDTKTVTPADQPQAETKQPVTTSDAQKAASKPARKTTPSKPVTGPQPKIEAVDPSGDELVENSSREATGAESKKSTITASHVAVETQAASKKYNFHYQFDGGKLVLYGPFDKSLYEILEIHGDQHAVFLYYKDNYFLLQEKQKKITELSPIKDPSLLKKLKDYRGN